MTNKIHELRTFFRTFSLIKGFDGWMIGNLYFFREEDKEKLPSVTVVKKKQVFAVLETRGNGIGIQMTVVKPKSISDGGHKAKNFSLPKDCVPVAARKFSREEILEFAQEVQDDNWIHQTENPIVQGLLMAEWVWETGEISLIDCTMTFRAPCYAEQEIVIYQDLSTRNYYAVVSEEKSEMEKESVRLSWEIRKKCGKS